MRRLALALARSRGQDGESCASQPGTRDEDRGVGNSGLSGEERRVLQELGLTNALRDRVGCAPSVSDSAGCSGRGGSSADAPALIQVLQTRSAVGARRVRAPGSLSGACWGLPSGAEGAPPRLFGS